MRTTPKMNHMKDVWKAYALKLLALNSDWWGRYHNKLENYYIYRSVVIDGKPSVELVFSYGQFKEIIDEFFLAAKVAVIDGEAVNLGNHIGKICARRIERDHSNKQVNWGRTKLQEMVLDESTGKMKPKKLIYFTEDDYCRIGLHKTGGIKNEMVYEFSPAESNKLGTGFKQEFAAALDRNILLRYRYLYFPLQKEKKKLLRKESIKYAQTLTT